MSQTVMKMNDPLLHMQPFVNIRFVFTVHVKSIIPPVLHKTSTKKANWYRDIGTLEHVGTHHF
jgi:hypothetical protein